MARTILFTGVAGFIGAALSQRLLLQGDRVVGLDNLIDSRAVNSFDHSAEDLLLRTT